MCDQQVRSFEVFDRKVIDYSTLSGEFWASGYDERAGDYLDLEVAPLLSNGKYIMVFTPVDLEEGSDAIEDIEIYRLIGTTKKFNKKEVHFSFGNLYN